MVKTFFKKGKRNLKAGFSLLEMLMVLAIFGILTSVVVFNYGQFNNQIVLTNMAYEVAMQIREAQVYSLGVQSNNNRFNDSYGVYFTKGSNSFISFKDEDPTLNDPTSGPDGLCKIGTGGGDEYCTCSGNSSDECIKQIVLTRNMKIKDFKIGGQSENGPIFISFRRPDPKAYIFNRTSPVNSFVDIILESQDGQTKKITVRENGYISVGNDE